MSRDGTLLYDALHVGPSGFTDAQRFERNLPQCA
jgi:hypothetical protein